MPTSPLNVASHLARLAAADPDRAALHVPRRGVNPRRTAPDAYTTLTFAQLHADSDALAHGLTAAGISRGTRVAVMVPPSVDFFSLTFALFKLAAVPVLLDPGMGVRNLGRCLAEAEPEAFIGIPKAQFARRLFGWAKKTIRIAVNAGRSRGFCHHSLDGLRAVGRPHGSFASPEVQADDLAAILFTSEGSTGAAKGVVYTHGIFAGQVALLKAIYGIEPGEVDLCTFPLFALFGPALGMTCVVPDMNPTRPARIDPRKAVKQIQQFGVTNLFGSPAVVRRLGECEVSSTKLETVRRVISAGAPVAATILEVLAARLPQDTPIYTPYGATEALPVSNIGSREILGETRYLTDQGRGVCVGRPVMGMSVYVVPISDGPIAEWDESQCLPPGQIGEFVVRGPVVTQSYHQHPEQTRLAKIFDTKTGAVLHRMGDVGYFDEQGRLWYCGRKSHRVETPKGTLFTEMVEGIFNTLPGVLRTALVGVTRDGVTHPVVCFEQLLPLCGTECNFEDWNKIVAWFRAHGQKFEQTRQIKEFLRHPGFPMDVRHNAKIVREKLAVWANAQGRPSLGFWRGRTL